ncbi:MAG: adenosyl-hopene transferase HpnH [Armatimonadetes bacterium]|nr:adenosyl-hopene transferase HpnH [Armatimonadota bacterium]
MRFPIGLSTSLAAYIVRKRLSGERFVPLVLMLEPLFACNLKCATCGRIREYKDHVSEMMSLDECVEAVRECGAPVVSICGGEPLIYPHIAELVDVLTHMRKYVYLCTNGVLLAEAVGKLKPSRHLLLNVHIDGPPEVHDFVVSKNGAYESAIKGIMLAARTGFQVTVNTTVCKQTDMHQIDVLMDKLSQMGVQCFMLSPAYSYESVESRDCFMSRADIHEKFRDIDRIAARHRLADSPIYLEYLKGERELQCTAWGNPTRNPMGWRSPCYLIADRHFAGYSELIAKTNWESYGIDKDPRCRDCMVHCGFEPTAALMVNKQQGDLWKMFRWQFG